MRDGKSQVRAEQVAGEILSLAQREGLEPGARLVEQRLAHALGVSRGPVRAGLKALESAGLITGARNRGYVLAQSPTSRPARTARSRPRMPASRSTRKLPMTVSTDGCPVW